MVFFKKQHRAHKHTERKHADMGTLEKLYLWIDAFNNRLGRIVSWVAIAMILAQFLIVVMRYIFSLGFIWMQESVLYMHATLFMLGASYTLLHEGHVRVDIYYREMTVRNKAMVDLIGSIVFLLPVCGLLWWWSWPYVEQSWSIGEGSRETSGIQAVFLLKTLILAFAGLIALQGVSMMIRSFLTLTGHRTLQPRDDGAHV